MFRCEYLLTPKLFESWQRGGRKKFDRTGLTVFWCLFGLIDLAGAVVSIIQQDFVSFAWLLGMAVFAVYEGFMKAPFLAKAAYKAQLRLFSNTDPIRVIDFEKESFKVIDGISRKQYTYDDIDGVYQKGNHVKFLMKDESLVHIYEDSFVVGNLEECLKYIRTMNPQALQK